jgi:hypothetical protein
MSQHDVTNLFSRARNKLNNTSRKASLFKDLIHNVIGVDSSRRWLPEDNVTHQSGCASQVTTNSSEVKW